MCKAGVVAVLLATTVMADAQPATVVQGPYLEVTAENTTADLEIGMTFKSRIALRPYVRVPFSDSDEQLIRVDKHSSAIKAGLGLDREIDLGQGDHGTARYLRFSLEAELGTKKFSYTPLDGSGPRSERHQSFSANLQAMYVMYATPDKPAKPSLQFVPQISLAYNRSYAAADAIGLVVPGSNGDPDMVEMVVAGAPSVAPTLTGRAGGPLYHGSMRPVALGLYAVGALSGEDYQPWGQQRMLRGELWTYLFLNAPANSRAGIALFAESSRATADSDSTSAYGLFVQLKLNTTMFEY